MCTQVYGVGVARRGLFFSCLLVRPLSRENAGIVTCLYTFRRCESVRDMDGSMPPNMSCHVMSWYGMDSCVAAVQSEYM